MRPHSATWILRLLAPAADILNKDVPACEWKVLLLTRADKQSWPANPVRKHKPLVPSFALATNLIGHKFYSHMDSKLLLYLETIFPCTVFVWQVKMDLRWILKLPEEQIPPRVIEHYVTIYWNFPYNIYAHGIRYRVREKVSAVYKYWSRILFLSHHGRDLPRYFCTW